MGSIIAFVALLCLVCAMASTLYGISENKRSYAINALSWLIIGLFLVFILKKCC